MTAPLAAAGELRLVPWPPSGGVLLVRDADELNPTEGMHLSLEELRWLATTGAMQAWLAVRPPLQLHRAPQAQPAPPQPAPDSLPEQGTLLGDDAPLA